MKVLGIDPGPVESAYVVWSGEKVLMLGIERNHFLLTDVFPECFREYPGIEMIVEQVASFGMAVGRTVFETVFWSGRLCQAWSGNWDRVTRMKVKMHLCHDSRAKDSNIRQALIDRFEPNLQSKCRPKDTLKGISKDCWSALAVAVYYYDTEYGKTRK